MSELLREDTPMNLRTTICFFLFVFMLYAGASYAARVEHGCSAEKFIPCPSFRVSRTIGEHTPIIDNHIAGFTRSKGKWTITVGYGPPEKCAKVSFWVDMGPLDFDREYKRVFIKGGGAVSDSGSFMHEIDDLASALRVHNGRCLVPAPEPHPESKERQALEEERERLSLEEERERLALEEERERLALEEERERLAEEQRLAEERERQRLAEKRRERERQRLAEQQRLEEDRERRRLAQQRRERARRIARQRKEQERRRTERKSGADAAAVLGLLKGMAGAASEMGKSGNPGMAILQGLADGLEGSSSTDSGGSPSYGGGGGQSCEQAKRRGARALASRSRPSGGMCAAHRSALRMYRTARRFLANGGCPAYEVRQYDRAIAQARRGVRAACR